MLSCMAVQFSLSIRDTHTALCGDIECNGTICWREAVQILVSYGHEGIMNRMYNRHRGN